MGNNTPACGCLILQSSETIEKGIRYLQIKHVLDPVLWIVHDLDQASSVSEKFPNTMVLNNYDICRLNLIAIPDDVKTLANEKAIAELHANLPILIEMMNRFEGKYPIEHVDRLTYIYNQFYYWAKVIPTKNIQLILQFDVPHDVYDYIIYIIATSNGIKTLYMHHANFYNSFEADGKENNTLVKVVTATNDLYSRDPILKDSKDNPMLHDLMKVSINSYYLDNVNNTALDKRKLLENEENTDLGYKISTLLRKILLFIKNPLYINNYIINTSKSIHKYPTIRQVFFIRRSIQKKTKILKEYYLSISRSSLPKNTRFLYFPLHFQPERSTCPDGDYYSSPYFILQEVLTYLDKDVVILVKEHSRQFNIKKLRNQSYRTTFLYDQISKLRNVSFISVNIETKDILQHPLLEGVITVRGNVILEACKNKIPVFIFGKTIFSQMPYAFNCSIRKNLININQLLKTPYSAIHNDRIDFDGHLNKIFKDSFVSCNDIHYHLDKTEQDRFNRYLLNCLH